MNPLQETMYSLVRQVPKGRITTYGILAEKLGNKNLSRAVGKWLGANPDLETTPCYKVVASNGHITGFAAGLEDKIKRLNDDGIYVENHKVINFKELIYRF